jgi:hypothetical protein
MLPATNGRRARWTDLGGCKVGDGKRLEFALLVHLVNGLQRLLERGTSVGGL